MKKSIALILSIITVVLVVLNNYFSYKIPTNQDSLDTINKSMDEVTSISQTNEWIAQNVIPKLDSLDSFENSEKDILDYETSIKETLNTTINNIDKSKKGLIMISVTSKIYRDDVKSLLTLFKLQIPNGHVKINKISTDSSFFVTDLDLIKFYKD